MTIDPGRTAYEARFAHEKNWPADGWETLPEDARAIWLRVEDAVLAGLGGLWFEMDLAPKDGTKIDLLFPYPRGRQNDCFWGHSELAGGKRWIWRSPTWRRESPGGLLPESQWSIGCYLNMEPLGWRRPPQMPESTEVEAR